MYDTAGCLEDVAAEAVTSLIGATSHSMQASPCHLAKPDDWKAHEHELRPDF